MHLVTVSRLYIKRSFAFLQFFGRVRKGRQRAYLEERGIRTKYNYLLVL